MASNVIEEFLVAVGYELDKDSKKDLDAFSKGIEKFAGNLVKMGAALAVGGAAVTAFVAKVSSEVDRLGKSSETINTAVENVDALGYALNIATGNSDSMVGSLQRLTRTASEAARGVGAGVEAFGILGVSTMENGRIKDTMQLLMETADAIASVEDESRQLELADKLGLGDMILLLRKGSSGIQNLVSEGIELATVTQEDTRKAADFMDTTFRALGRMGKGIAVLFASTVSPAITDMVAQFQEWFILNKALIRENVVVLAVAFADAFKFFMGILAGTAKATFDLIQALGGLRTVLTGLTVALSLLFAYNLGGLVTMLGSLIGWLTAKIVAMGFAGAASFAAVHASMLLMGVVLILLIGLVDEIVTMFIGGETVIGSFFDIMYERFPGLGAVMQIVGDSIWSVWEITKALIDLLADPFNAESWTKFFTFIQDELGELVDNIIEELNKIPGINISTGKEVGGLGKDASFGQVAAASFNDLASPATVAKMFLQNPMSMMGDLFSDIWSKTNPYGDLSPATSGGSILQAAPVTVNVNQSNATAEQISEAVKTAVGESNREALKNLETRVRK